MALFTVQGIRQITTTVVTWDPNTATVNLVLSNGNLKATSSGGGFQNVIATLGKASGGSNKYVFELHADTIASQLVIGLALLTANLTAGHYLGQDANGWGYGSTGSINNNGGTPQSFASWAAGDVIGVGYNTNTNTAEWFKNGVSQGTSTIATGTWYPAITCIANTDSGTADFGATAFANTYTGYLGWNSA